MVDIQTTVFTVANRSLSLDTVTVFSYTLYFMYNSSVPVASTAYKVYVGMNNLRANFESHRAFKKSPILFSTSLLDNLASISPGPAEHSRESGDVFLITFIR